MSSITEKFDTKKDAKRIDKIINDTIVLDYEIDGDIVTITYDDDFSKENLTRHLNNAILQLKEVITTFKIDTAKAVYEDIALYIFAKTSDFAWLKQFLNQNDEQGRVVENFISKGRCLVEVSNNTKNPIKLLLAKKLSKSFQRQLLPEGSRDLVMILKEGREDVLFPEDKIDDTDYLFSLLSHLTIIQKRLEIVQ